MDRKDVSWSFLFTYTVNCCLNHSSSSGREQDEVKSILKRQEISYLLVLVNFVFMGLVHKEKAKQKEKALCNE